MTNPVISIINSTNHLIHQSGLTLGRMVRTPSPWWVIIHTQNPTCTYYFGPFDSKAEAVTAQAGYIEDLEQEDAEGIQVNIQQLSPRKLTLD